MEGTLIPLLVFKWEKFASCPAEVALVKVPRWLAAAVPVRPV